jgi:ABC-type polysaccharide/polyol phosphate transport system ATPase subunit
MSETLIKVENLHKKFCQSLKRSMLYGTLDATKSMFGLPIENVELRKKEFWALQDINFELKRGETLGLIGQNGCGKTTLLRLLNGIFPPDKGKITIKGRIGALIAVGAGFHPHMTGRENIYLNGTILGMTKDEIKRKLDEIIDFAEIGDFIDAPVATYSSGMTVRLGFSIAIHCEPDILLIDEILAVGDYAFHMKCYNKLQQLISNCSVILVSHDELSIRSVCKEVALFKNGKLLQVGSTDDMLISYRSMVIREQLEKNIKTGIQGGSIFSEKLFSLNFAHLLHLELKDKNRNIIRINDKELSKIKYSVNNKLICIIDLEIVERIINPRISFYIRDLSKAELTYVCASSISRQTNPEIEFIEKGLFQLHFELDISRLTPNVYNVICGIGDELVHTKIYGGIDETDRITFEIINSNEFIATDALLNKPYFLSEYKFHIEKSKV